MFGNEVLTSVAPSHATKVPAGTERYECRGVRMFLDGVAI